MKSTISVLIFLVFMMSSCMASDNNFSATMTIGIEATPTSTNHPAETTPLHQDTEKTVEVTKAFNVTPTAQTLNMGQLSVDFSLPCLDISSDSVDKLGLSGYLFATNVHGGSIFNLKNGQRTAIREDLRGLNWDNVFISPHGNWVAYIAYQRDNKVISLVVEPAGNLWINSPQKPIVWGTGTSFRLEDWFTNETLVITRQTKPDAFSSTLILNPFTGEEKEFFLEDQPNYKYFKSGGVPLYHFFSSNLMPDPSLQRIVYPELVDSHEYISLLNLETHKIQAKIEDFYAYSGDPLWAWDGSNFLITASTLHTNSKTIFDWFQVTRNGVVKQITYFSEVLKNNEISNASRSVDGRYLAFKIKYQNDVAEQVRYYILDLRKEPYESFCIESVDTPSSFLEKRPIWSPDSQYMVITNTDDNNNGPLILVDLNKRIAYEISQDIHAKGWIIKP